MSEQPKRFTEAQKEQLQHEDFIAEVLKKRPSPPPKRAWQIFLESSGGVAIITLLLGGAFSTWIAHILQEGAAEREFKNEIIKIYAQHSLNSEKGILEQRDATLTSGLALLGSVTTSAQGRIDIDGKRFAKRRDPKLEKKNSAQKEEIRRRFNESGELWEAKKRSLEYQFGFYFGSKAQLAWSESAVSVDSFLECADQNRPGPNGDLGCEQERREVESRAAELISSVARAPTGEWLSKEDVSEIRDFLDESS